jgi:lipopolysaccharide transport system permease protein
MSQYSEGQTFLASSNKIYRIWDLFCPNHKFLVYNLIQRNLKLKYKKSVLGFLWSLMAPASTALIYYMIFKFVMKVSIPNYITFILMGILPWNFFLTCLSGGLDSLVTNHNLLNKIPLPIHSLPFAEVLTAFINFSLSLPVVLIAALIFQAPVTWNYLLIPAFLFFLVMQCYAYALILSVGYVYLKDLRHAMSIGTQLLFYLTPVLYKIEMVPEHLRFLIYLNPLSMIFSSLNLIVSEGIAPSSFQFAHAIGCSLFIFLTSYFVFKKQQFLVIENL